MRISKLAVHLLGAAALSAAAQAQVSIIDSAPGGFIDISGTGMPLSLADDGEADIATTVGNSLLAAGTARVGSNGGIRFAGAGTDLGFTNQTLPSADAFSGDQALLPFWDDVNTASGTAGEIYWEEVGGVLIVQWEDVGFFNSTDTATWQVQVFGSGPVVAQFLYEDIESVRTNGGESATIGYQAGGHCNDVEYSFNTAGSVSNGTVLSVVHTSELLWESSISGSFVDISGTGTALNLADDGEADIATTVGNSLLAAGTARVGSNGGIRFAGAGANLGFTNQTLPSADAFSGDQTLLPFWDDVNTAGGTAGNIYWEEVGGVLIVQWEDVGFFNSTDTATWQVQVFPDGGPAFAQVLFEDIESARTNGGESATIGYQAGGIGNDAQYSFDTAGAVSNGTVLSLVEGCPPLFETICRGTVVANSSGGPGMCSASGTQETSLNALTLHADGLPMNSNGFFFTSHEQNFVAMPGNSVGNICIASLTIGRYDMPSQVQNSGTSGSVSLPIDLTMTPFAGGGMAGFTSVMPGETRYFQYWFRDMDPTGAATNNFTDAICITFR